MVHCTWVKSDLDLAQVQRALLELTSLQLPAVLCTSSQHDMEQSCRQVLPEVPLCVIIFAGYVAEMSYKLYRSVLNNMTYSRR